MVRSVRSSVFASLLLLLLAVPPAFAGTHRAPGERSFDLLAAFRLALGQFVSTVPKLGAGMDPAGTPGQRQQGDIGSEDSPEAPTNDLGAGMDPAGTPHQ